LAAHGAIFVRYRRKPVDLTAACERSKPCTGAELEGLVAGGDIAQKFAASARIVPAYNG
jgi:hypothetical protein